MKINNFLEVMGGIYNRGFVAEDITYVTSNKVLDLNDHIIIAQGGGDVVITVPSTLNNWKAQYMFINQANSLTVITPDDIHHNITGVSMLFTEKNNAYTIAPLGEGSGGGGGGGSYTNPNPTPVAVGGIPAGSTFSNINLTTMWNNLLYPYQYPAFSYFYIQSVSTVKEVGSYLIGNTAAINSFDFRWDTTNQDNINDNTIEISAGGETYLTGGSNDKQETVSKNDIQYNVPTILNFTIQGQNTRGEVFSRTQSYSWRWKCYWGTSTEESLTETGIKGLASSDLLTTYTGTRNYPAGGYKYFAIPEEFVQPSTFIDADGNFEVAMDEVYDLTITNDYGLTTTYKVYRTKNSLAGELNMLTN